MLCLAIRAKFAQCACHCTPFLFVCFVRLPCQCWRIFSRSIFLFSYFAATIVPTMYAILHSVMRFIYSSIFFFLFYFSIFHWYCKWTAICTVIHFYKLKSSNADMPHPTKSYQHSTYRNERCTHAITIDFFRIGAIRILFFLQPYDTFRYISIGHWSVNRVMVWARAHIASLWSLHEMCNKSLYL